MGENEIEQGEARSFPTIGTRLRGIVILCTSFAHSTRMKFEIVEAFGA